jgi:phosphatidylglycerol:prolipoprotein diacylglycerol transferase
MSLLSIYWNVSPIMFKLGGIEVRWYGVLFALAFVVSYILMKKVFTKEKVPPYYLDKLAIYIFIGVLVGARLGHCLFYEFSYYSHHIIEMILPIKQTPQGWHFIGYQGLASHGAAIGIFIAVYLYCRKTKISFMWLLDRLMIAVCFAGASIRLGNLMNSEIYGQATSLAWGFVFVRDGQTIACHPTQLYEALSYIILGTCLYLMLMKKDKLPRQGFVFGLFLVCLFGARFFIEFLKNPQEIWEQTLPLDMGQWLSIPFIIAGIILMIVSKKKDIGKKLDINILTPKKENRK